MRSMEQGCNGHRVEHLQLRNGSASLPQLVHRTFGEDVLHLCPQVGLLLELKHFFPSCGNWATALCGCALGIACLVLLRYQSSSLEEEG